MSNHTAKKLDSTDSDSVAECGTMNLRIVYRVSVDRSSCIGTKARLAERLLVH